ncbi:LysR family transcriptional regulator [Niveispirillum sp. SYP-B3756]|uniref:LysR family transcriptional regulator n=1 Tax=Niveispirillum sp. SYP-B3756 TaxID=2662178 RepID=UPI0012912416|nr:LysR family transcriptional regulator [Niveispirillum sp. SYP-B3756]MQP64397.1 LysR family transcriptional regulator [Niveispirillum sp. SYP-B3756]
MTRPHLPLNALRAFEASARHLSFTKAAIELCVTQAAVSHQVKGLEARLGAKLFRRLPRGLVLTDEGIALLPGVRDSFDRIGRLLHRFEVGRVTEVLSVGVVGTFAVGWLLPRLADFRERHPFIDLRIMTNNNRVDVAAEGLDAAIRFGDGAWHGMEAVSLFEAPMSPLCSPATAARLRQPADLAGEVLLRSYRADEWPHWFAAAGCDCPAVRGPIFDSSWLMVEAALQGHGVALAPAMMFSREIEAGRLVQPFATGTVNGRYWLTWLKSRPASRALSAFADWLGGDSPA